MSIYIFNYHFNDMINTYIYAIRIRFKVQYFSHIRLFIKFDHTLQMREILIH